MDKYSKIQESGQIMTKDVMVTIAGFHVAEEEEDTIEMVHVGEYYERGGTHYILYKEQMDGMKEPVKNLIKLREHRMEIRKRGPVRTNMVFEEQKSQSTTYVIPYGSFLMEIYTTKVQIIMEENRLRAKALYELNVNGVRCAKCDIRIQVQARESFQLMTDGTD